MSVEDETVVDVDLKLGFNHRSIIKLMERRDYYKDIYLAERICGFCNIHHTQTFVMAVENILEIEIPRKAKYIRTLLGELERLKSHLLAIGLVADLTGFRTMLMHSLRLREEILDSLEVISGQRISHGAMTLGGVKIDITPAHADFIQSKLKSLKSSAYEFFEQYLASDILIGRLKGVGHLSPADARKFGAVGPLVRGSGLPFDVRKQFPYAAYEDVSWEVVTENGADSLARLQVRMQEFMVALNICEQCCDFLRSVPSSSPIVSTMHELPCGEGVAKSEPPRGELLYHVASNGTNTPDFVRLRVPTFPNAPILLKLLKGGNIADVPVIIGSVDPCFSCTDRATVVQANMEVQIHVKAGKME
jgi:NADH-quinone oxidoreductase subunit D